MWRGLIYNTYNNSANNLISLFKKPIIYFGWFPLIYKPEPNYVYQIPLDIRWHVIWIIFLLYGAFSKLLFLLGFSMLIISIVTCALIASIAVNRKHVATLEELHEFFVITLLSFLWSFVRRLGQFMGEIYIRQGKDTRGIKLK